MPDLKPLLSPDSVAIIGAAADSSLRGRLTQQLIEHGFDGRIYPVTRSQQEVLGHKAYAAVGVTTDHESVEVQDALAKARAGMTLLMRQGSGCFDVPEVVRLARKHGFAVGLDCAHGAGNLSLRLHDWGVDFAVWCNYKYLNAGPGGLGGAFVHQRHAR